MCQNNPELLSK